MPRRESQASPIEQLSPRRRELLELLAKGLTNDEIARTLGITPGTVRTHVTTLLAQLDVSNRTEAAAVYVAWESRPARVAAVLRRPAIAVLPFAPLGDDPQTALVANGLSEDVAALFARWCWFPVIATSSTVQARALGPTAREIGAALEARFVLDGSLRRLGRQWRLMTHIDDAETGHRLWTDRREFPWSRVGEVEDAICEAVVVAAYPVLEARALAHRREARPGEQSAWELAYDGMALRARRDPGSNTAAVERFRAALRREPELVLAHYGLGLASYDAVLNQWGPLAPAHAALLSAAEECVRWAPHAAEGPYLLARAEQSRGAWDEAVRPLEQAIALNPSFALAHAGLSQSLSVCGRSDEALERMAHAVRLGPRSFVAGLATLHFMLSEWEKAREAAERAVAASPHYPFARAIAAASNWYAGDVERGRLHLAALRRTHPHFRPEGFGRTFGASTDAVRRFVAALAALAEAG